MHFVEKNKILKKKNNLSFSRVLQIIFSLYRSMWVLRKQIRCWNCDDRAHHNRPGFMCELKAILYCAGAEKPDWRLPDLYLYHITLNVCCLDKIPTGTVSNLFSLVF